MFSSYSLMLSRDDVEISSLLMSRLLCRDLEIQSHYLDIKMIFLKGLDILKSATAISPLSEQNFNFKMWCWDLILIKFNKTNLKRYAPLALVSFVTHTVHVCINSNFVCDANS